MAALFQYFSLLNFHNMKYLNPITHSFFIHLAIIAFTPFVGSNSGAKCFILYWVSESMIVFPSWLPILFLASFLCMFKLINMCIRTGLFLHSVIGSKVGNSFVTHSPSVWPTAQQACKQDQYYLQLCVDYKSNFNHKMSQ